MKRSVTLTLILAVLLCTLILLVTAKCGYRDLENPEDVTIDTIPVISETPSPEISDSSEPPHEIEDPEESDEPPLLAKDPSELCDEYLDGMVSACLEGNYDLGVYYEYLRNDLILMHTLDDPYIDYEDLYYMSKIIYFESGSYWMTDEHQCLVGAVLYNRSKSPEFPDSIKECVYQKDQYSPVKKSNFETTNPEERNVRNALLVLTEEFVIPETVVFQANFKQGSGVYKKIYDSKLGTTTYFCYSSYPELYE